LGDDTALPIIMYDIPSFTKNTVSPVVVADLAQHERIIGLKDSTRDLEHLLQLLDALRAAEIEGDQFSIMTGTDTMLLESLQAGASGAIVASANVAAQLSVGIYRSWAAGNLPRATGLERQLRELVAACRVGTFPAGWKAAASALGICRADLVAPRRALGDGDRTELVARLRQSGLLGGLAEAGVGSRNPR
jgi:4-hydroxy-tetrahydrodipicolinate synthase